MARPREFEIDEVLQKAMTVFWRQGYAATSMADLYAATGLKPGNLYATFKDKETLFRRCFETYAAHFRATLPSESTGLEATQAWLATQVRLAVEDPERKGCLIVNTITEREQHSEATRALARGRVQEIRDFFLRSLGQARSSGELADGADVEAHADALTGAVLSIMTLGRAGADRRAIENVGRIAAAGLPRAIAGSRSGDQEK